MVVEQLNAGVKADNIHLENGSYYTYPKVMIRRIFSLLEVRDNNALVALDNLMEVSVMLYERSVSPSSDIEPETIGKELWQDANGLINRFLRTNKLKTPSGIILNKLLTGAINAQEFAVTVNDLGVLKDSGVDPWDLMREFDEFQSQFS